MRAAEQKRYVPHRFVRHHSQGLRRYFQHLLTVERSNRDVLLRQKAISRAIFFQRKRILVDKFRRCHNCHLAWGYSNEKRMPCRWAPHWEGCWAGFSAMLLTPFPRM